MDRHLNFKHLGIKNKKRTFNSIQFNFNTIARIKLLVLNQALTNRDLIQYYRCNYITHKQTRKKTEKTKKKKQQHKI